MKTKQILILIAISFVALYACTDDEVLSEPASLSVNVQLVSFGGTEPGSTSSTESYMLTGTGIEERLELSTEAPFYVSLSQAEGFDTSLTIAPDQFGDGEVVVYVQFSPAADNAGGDVSSTIVHSSESLESDIELTVSGTVLEDAPIIQSATTSLDFGSVREGEDSDPQMYLLSVLNLTDDLNLSTTGPFLISTTEDGTYETLMDISISEITNGEVTLYAKLSGVDASAGEATGSITHSTVGATDFEITLTGEIESAAVVLYQEEFDYSEDFLPTIPRQGGAGAGAVNAQEKENYLAIRPNRNGIVLLDENLSMEGYNSPVGKSMLIDFEAGADPLDDDIIAWNFDNQQTAETTADYFLSFLINVTEAPGVDDELYNVAFSSWNDNGSLQWLGMVNIVNVAASSDDQADLRFVTCENRASALSDTSDVNVQLNTTYLVVVKQSVNSADPSQNYVKSYLFDSTPPSEEPDNAMGHLPALLLTDRLIDNVALLETERDKNGACIVDAVKMANTWADLFD